ncbi:MAG: tRNA guanosine(34) transglycosylase Tgt [Acidobacteria bacterium]|nr:MAG: tRNA guanosine(34) transglycosylase Tgt [Acidobacteriota bacterium]PYQ64560.1 MAG: tRNA guanosine(34) transglycosylase Tgt [Acidobacteriota bacterium]
MSDSLFRILARDPDSAGRTGIVPTAHGAIETPCFLPVGTRGAVKGIEFDRLEEWDCRAILANTYHLMARPGREIIRRAGGLHAFLGWNRAILTDSGGFQVMSLSSRRRLTEEGVEFRTPEDGTRHFLTPELAVELQSEFGVDIAMTLDVCPPFPAERRQVEEACRLSLRWAERSRQTWSGTGLLFGIVQGGTHEDLRASSAGPLVDLDFDGYAIGGVAVGEPKEAIRQITRFSAALLPEEKPRYLMGVGTPADLVASVRAGVDLFDCVLPTRHGRMGHAYTRAGEVTIKHERFKEDLAPLDSECACPVCRRHTRAYLRHLFVLGDFSAPMLLSIHNVFFYLEWMKRIRNAISEGELATLRAPPEGKIE